MNCFCETSGLLTSLLAETEVSANDAGCWVRPSVSGAGPEPRGGHSATVVGDRMLVIGGERGFQQLSDLHVLDIPVNEWITVREAGDKPPPRSFHTACRVGDSIVIFGGKGPKPLADVYELDIKIRAHYDWGRRRIVGEPCAARFGHTACTWKFSILVFGGTNDDCFLDDLCILDLKVSTWLHPETQGRGPARRAMHSSGIVDGKLIIHGGLRMENDRPVYLNDVTVLLIESMSWCRIRTHGIPPSKRYGHHLVVTGGRLVCCGGWGPSDHNAASCKSLNLTTMEWEDLEPLPAERYGISAVSVNSHIIVFGGWGRTTAVADLIVLTDSR